MWCHPTPRRPPPHVVSNHLWIGFLALGISAEHMISFSTMCSDHNLVFLPGFVGNPCAALYWDLPASRRVKMDPSRFVAQLLFTLNHAGQSGGTGKADSPVPISTQGALIQTLLLLIPLPLCGHRHNRDASGVSLLLFPRGGLKSFDCRVLRDKTHKSASRVLRAAALTGF